MPSVVFCLNSGTMPALFLDLCKYALTESLYESDAQTRRVEIDV